MPSSKLDIVNVSLANLGVEPLHSFDEQNSRARLCSTLYNSAWMYVLSDGQWSFCTKLKQIAEAEDEDFYVPEGYALYTLPSDCVKPIDLFPANQKVNWERVGNYLLVEGVYELIALRYSFYQSNTFLFPPYFCEALSAYLLMLLARPLTGVKTGARKELHVQYEQIRDTALVTDANANANHRHKSYDPENDSFSN